MTDTRAIRERLLGMEADVRRAVLDRMLADPSVVGDLERLAALPDDELAALWAQARLDDERAQLAGMADLATLLGRPSVATAWAVKAWRGVARFEGVHPATMQVARELLRREREDGDGLADPDNDDEVLLLARGWRTHARDFLAGLPWPEVPPRDGADWLDVHPYELRDVEWPGRVAAAVALRSEVPEARAEMDAWLDERDREIGALSVDRVPWLSHELAEYLRKLGASDDVVGAWLGRERSPDPGQGELPINAPPPPALPGWMTANGVPTWGVSRAAVYLARAVWRVLRRPQVEARRRHDDARPEAGVLALFARSGAGLVAVRQGVKVNERGRLVSEGGAVLHVGPSVDLDVARYVQAVPALGTLAAQRFIRWAPRVVYEAFRAADTGRREWTSADGTTTAEVTADGVRVRVAGGWAGLAQTVNGTTNPRLERSVRELVEVLGSTRLFYRTTTGEGEHPLLYGWHREQRGNQNVKGWIQIRLPTWWGSAPANWETTPAELRKIVPILPVPALPPSLPRFHAELAAVDLAAMAELAEHADDLVERGGVEIPWDRLAHDAGIKHAHVLEALEAWQAPADERPARWARVGKRWTLAENDETAGALESLRELGKRIAKGRAGGRKSAATKRNAARRFSLK